MVGKSLRIKSLLWLIGRYYLVGVGGERIELPSGSSVHWLDLKMGF